MDRPKTPPPSIRCRCVGRCKCCDAPKRPNKCLTSHNNKQGKDLFGVKKFIIYNY